MSCVLRPAAAADAANLSALGERTFRETFAATNTAEDMDLYCASTFSQARQSAEIADAGLRTMVAESDGGLVAFAQVDLRSKPPDCVPVLPSVELRRLYVERRFQGTGLAQALMADALNAPEVQGAAIIWLGVWEHNPRAIRFYQRFGFSEVGDHVFVVGTDPQRDLVMIRRVSA